MYNMNQNTHQNKTITPQSFTQNTTDFSTEATERINKIREEALSSYMAGQTATTTPEQQTKSTTIQNINTDTFSTQQNVLSHLDLLDENLNAQDTYSNYIARGGSPVPGYEQDHTNLLFLDRVHDAQTQIEQGTISKEAALFDLYGHDLLITNNYNIDSVGWWQSKFNNHDYSNPLKNQVLMQSILNQAEELHNSILAKEYAAKQKVKDSHLSTLLNKGDLSNDDIRSLFPEITEALDKIDEDKTHDYQWYLSAGRINPQDRIYHASDNTMYYLHTDGQLYRLSNEEKGPKIASYQMNDDGTFKEISINGSSLLDATQEFKAGALSTISGFTKLVAAVWGASGGYLINGLGDGDWDFINSVTDSMSQIDVWNNDSLSLLFDSKRVDMDGFQWNTKDVSMFLCNITGSMVGGWATGALAGKGAKFGADLAEHTTGFTHNVGKAMEIGGNLYAMSTGLYRGYTKEAANTFSILGHELGNIGGWAPTLNHTKTVGIYMIKDFNNNLAQLNAQRFQYQLKHPDEDLPDDSKKILGVAAINAAFNGIISSFLAGGIDDNQTERWTSVFLPDKTTGQIAVKGALAGFLDKWSIGINTMADFLDNAITMYTGNIIGWDKDHNSFGDMFVNGAFTQDDNGNRRFDKTNVFKTLIQAGISTVPTLAGQLQRRNIAGENAKAIWDNLLNNLEEAEKNATPDGKHAIREMRALVIEEFNKQAESTTLSQRIFNVLDTLHENVKDDMNSSIVTKSIEAVCAPKMLSVYKDMNDIAVEAYDKHLEIYRAHSKNVKTKGLKAALTNLVTSNFRNYFTSHQAAVANEIENAHINEFANNLYTYFVTATNSSESETAADVVRNAITITAEELDRVEDVTLNYNEFSKSHDKDMQKKAEDAATTLAKSLGVDVQVIKDSTKYYSFKNETENRDLLNSDRAAMIMLTKLLPDTAYKIDDYTYGILGTGNNLSNMFTESVATKMLLSMHALHQGSVEASVDLYMKTILGDDGFKNVINSDKTTTKELVEDYLNTAIENHVIDKIDAAEFLIELKDKTAEQTDLHKTLNKIFDTELNIKNVTKTDLSDLELYAALYRAARHLNDPEVTRFSGPTIAAQVLLDSNSKVADKVISDLVDKRLLNSDFLKLYSDKITKIKANEVFKYATEEFFSGVVEVFGEEGLKNIPGEQDLNGRKDLITTLKALADNNVNDAEVHNKIKNLISLGETLEGLNGITFDGDKVTLDLTSYMTMSVEKFIKEVANTQPDSETSRQNKESYSTTPYDKDSKAYLEQATKIVDSGKAFMTIDLNDDNMETILKIYHVMNDAGMFTDMASTEPKDAKEFKNYLQHYLTDNGKDFAKYKKGTEFNSNIINAKEANDIVERLKLVKQDSDIARIREINPNNKYVAEYDYYTLLKNNIGIHNISTQMHGLMRKDSTKGLIVNPVEFETEGEPDGEYVYSYIKLPTGNKRKDGRIASQAGENYANINNDAVAMNVNKDMTTKIMISKYIDYLYDQPALDIMVKTSLLPKLEKLGLINTPDAFYNAAETPLTFSGESYMRLYLSKKDKSAMKNYLESNAEINLFKILPFYSTEMIDSSLNFNTPQARLLGDIPDIQGRGVTTYANVYGIFNMTFDFDQSNTLKTNLLKEFIANKDSLVFNPFSENNIPLNIKKVKEELGLGDNVSDTEAYAIYRDGNILAGVDDYVYALVETYDQLQKTYINDDKNDDALVWLQNPNVLKHMVKFAQDDTDIETVIDQTVKAYGDSTYRGNISDYNQVYVTKYDDLIVGNSYGIPSNITNVDTVMSKPLLDNDMGIVYELVDTSGKPNIANYREQITDAYNYVKNMISKYSNVQEMLDAVSKPTDEVFRIYEPSGTIKLQAIFGESEGNIMIEDIDTLSRIEAEQYRIFFDEMLGYEAGHGQKIYDKVITLKEKLMKHIGDYAKPTPTVSSAVRPQTLNTYARIFEGAPDIAKGRGNLKNIKRYIGNFIDDNLDARNINITPDRLIDTLGEASRTVTEDLNRIKEVEDPFLKAQRDRVQQIAVRDNADINGQTLVNDISSDINLYKLLNSTRNTKTSIDEKILKPLNISTENPEITQNVINYTTDLVYRASGVDYLSNWAKFSFLNPETGTEYAMANIEKIGSSTSHMDLLNTVLKEDTNLIGKVFIDLNKHKVDSMDGLSYSFKTIENQEDLTNLKTDLYLKVAQENAFRAESKFKDAADIINHMTNQEFNIFMQKAARENLGTVAKTRYLLNLMDATNIQVPYKYIIQPQNYKNDLLKNFIAKHYGTPTAARIDSDTQVRKMTDAILYGISYEGLDSEHKQLADTFYSHISDKFSKIYDYDMYTVTSPMKYYHNKIETSDLTDTEWTTLRNIYGVKKDASIKDLTEIAERYIINTMKAPETMSYLFNKRKSLNNMYKDYNQDMPDTYTLSDGSKMGVQNLNNFFQEGTKSTLNKIIGFDTEGSNKIKPATGNTADSINDLFQISFVIYTKDELGNLHSEQITKFIKHDITPEEWVKAQIDFGNTFYKENESYRNAIEAYRHATDEDMISYNEIEDILTGRLTNSPDAVIAYNGNNYEFRILEKYLGGVKTLDAIDTILKEYSDTTKSISQDSVYKRTFSTDRGEKHSADQDTLDMMDLIKNVSGLDVSMKDDRSRLVLNLKNLLNVDDATLKKVFSKTHEFFHGDGQLRRIYKDFNDYEPTLDNIKQMQRAYNYLMNDADGKALFDIREQLDANSVCAQFVKLSTGQIDNALNIIAIKMLDTEGSYSEAINKLTNVVFDKTDGIDNFDDKVFNNFLRMLGNKDEEFLTKANIDLDLVDNEEVQRNKRAILDQYNKGLYGYTNGKIDLVNKEEAKLYAENFNNLSYITGTQAAIIDNRDYISEAVQNDLMNTFGSGMLSLKEGMSVEDLRTRLNTSINYNSKLIDSLAEQINNIIGESKGTGTFRGIYHMSTSLNPQENDVAEIEYRDGKLIRSGEKLKDVKAGEISLTLSMLKEKFNITDLKDLEADDGNLYILSITNPADNMTPILPLRVRLVEGDEMSAGFTPDTQEILRHRDFDGDHSLTSMLSPSMKEMAPLLYKYAFSPYNVYSKLTNYLNIKQGSPSRNKSRILSMDDNSRIFVLGTTNQRIIEDSIKLDDLLRANKSDVNLTDEALAKVKEIQEDIKVAIKESEEYPLLKISLGITTPEEETKFLEHAVELLGMREIFKNQSDTIRYVNNPYMYAKKRNGKETYSYIARKGTVARQLLEKTNMGDSVVGKHQKDLSILPIEPKVIDNPMLDLYTPNIYMNSTLESGIDNVVKDTNSFINYFRNFADYLKSEVTIDKYSESAVKWYTDFVDGQYAKIITMASNLEPKDYQAYAKQFTMEALWDLDAYIKRQPEPNAKFKVALEKLSTDDTFKQQLDKTIELDNILKKLTNEREKVGSKYIKYTPYSDILSQDIIMNKVNHINETDILNGTTYETPFNYGNKLFTNEDKMLKQLDDISNGFNKVNIFLTKGFSDTSTDIIGVTQNSKARALGIEVLDPTTAEYNLKPNTSYEKGTVIGRNFDGTPIKAKKDFHVDRVTDNSIIIDTEGSVAGKKLAAIGIAKGNSKNVILRDKNGNDTDVDLVCDINNAFKNFDKLPIGIDTQTLLENMEETSFYDSQGREHHGYLLKYIPFNIIGDDTKYKAALDVNDPSSIRRFELMTTNTAESLLGIGRYGSTVVKMDDKGNIIVDFSEVQKAAASNFKNYDVNYADVGANIMYYRTDALVNAMTEEEFLGFVNALDNGKYANTFKSKEDYLKNRRESMFMLNSEASLNEQLDMIHYLGKERFYKLVDSCKLNEFIFGGIVNSQLHKFGNSSFTEDFWNNPRLPRSKSSSTYDYSNDEKKISEWKVMNESQRDSRFTNILHDTLLHIPANVFYKGITGRNLDTNSILRMHLNGTMSPRYHYANSANIDTDWYAIDTLRGVKTEDAVGNFASGDGQKTILGGESDSKINRNLNAGKWTRGTQVDDMLDVHDQPHKANFYNVLNRAATASYPTTGVSWNTRLGYMLALGLDKNKTDLEKFGILRGIDSVNVNKLTPQMISDSNRMYYQSIINSNTVPVRDFMKTVNENTKGYTLRTDLEGFTPSIDSSREDIKAVRDRIKNIKENSKEYNEYQKQKSRIYKQAEAMLSTSKAEYDNNQLQLTWDTVDKQIEWKTNWMTRSGIDDRGAEQLSVDIGIKNYKAEIPYIMEQYSEPLNKLKKYTTIIGTKEFEKFAKYQWLDIASKVDPKNFDTRLSLMGESTESMKFLKADYEEFITKYPEITKAYNEHIDNLMELSKKASKVTGEPFTNNFIFMMPFVSNDKTIRENEIYSTIKNMATLSKYDPTTPRNIMQQNMAYNFFEGSDRIMRDLATTIASNNISEALLGKYNGEALMDNKSIIDTAYKIINDTQVIDSMKPYVKFDSDITDTVLNIVSLYTDLDLKYIKKNIDKPQELLQRCFNAVKYDVESLQDELVLEHGFEKPLTLSEAYRIGNGDLSKSYDTKIVDNCRKLYQEMHGQILIAQRIMESDKYASSRLNNYISELYASGKVLVNKFGQKIERNGIVAPTDKASFGYLKDNIEIAMNSKTPDMFNQYVFEKALSGELYIMDKGLADQLSEHVWTAKVPSRVQKVLQKASSLSASIQMAMPLKMLSRMLRFTGTDYAMGVVSNTDVAKYIPKACTELSAALQSQGNNISKTLEGYLIREGQGDIGGLPTLSKSATRVDPLDPSIKISPIMSGLTRPLDFQNHLGRYAIYLAALDGFKKQEAGQGEAWYGSQYYNHKAIDALKSPEDKAMYVMDYMLGSPGGFPALSKKTSGYLMYATFPMNFTRTLGAYCMSVGKLFSEGIQEENKTQWYNNIIMPSVGMTGLSILSNAIISAICDYYDVDEDKEEEWKKEGVTLDPIGTLIGGTPSVVYDSINPAYIAKEMFINPFTNKYNDTLPKKAYGWMKANILSSLNPLAKIPIEVTTGKDLWGDSAEGYKTSEGLFEANKKYQYTNIENGMRKVFGILVGSGVANNIMDQMKMDAYDPENPSMLSTLWKGFTKGLSADIGNQKSWKKDTSNYYSILTDMKQYSKTAKDTYGNTYGNNYYYDIEDLANADKLEYARKYGSRYGTFDEVDYNRVNAMLKKMIESHTDASTIYNYIVKEYNENNVSEATMRSALNNNSIVRKLRLSTMSGYTKTLNESELLRLQKAIAYENEYYPILQKLFPDKESSRTYIPSYKKTYLGSGSGSGGTSYPKTYVPRTYVPKYYPGKYYPSTYKYNKATGKYRANLDRVSVHVSPQMAIWNQDKNLTRYDTGIQTKNEPKWLRSNDYINRTNQP